MPPIYNIASTYLRRDPTTRYRERKPITFRNTEQENLYHALVEGPLAKKVVKELAPCYDTMLHYDIDGPVIDILNDSGLQMYEILCHARHPNLVYEFISSFSPCYDNSGNIDGWHYRMQNKNCGMTKADVIRLLDFYPGGGPVPVYTEEQREEYWSAISPCRLRYTAAIISPTHRYLHAVIAKNFYPRTGPMEMVHDRELDFLQALDDRVVIDFFSFFTERFMKMKSLEDENEKLLGCSAIITCLAKLEKFRFRNEEANIRYFDKFKLARMGMVNSTTFRWIQNFRQRRRERRRSSSYVDYEWVPNVGSSSGSN